MLRHAAVVILVLILFGNCKKEPDEFKVTFTVRETSADAPPYNITYTSDKSGATTMVSSSSDAWSSSVVMLERGQFVSMTVDCTAPLFDIKLSVFVNGFLWQSKDMHNATSTMTISGRP